MEEIAKEHIETEEEKRFKPCCETCRFSRERHEIENDRFRLCCKQPPSVEGFPMVMDFEWCAEHKFWEDELNGKDS